MDTQGWGGGIERLEKPYTTLFTTTTPGIEGISKLMKANKKNLNQKHFLTTIPLSTVISSLNLNYFAFPSLFFFEFSKQQQAG